MANQSPFDISDILEDAQRMANDTYGQGEIGRSLLRAVRLFTREQDAPTAVGRPRGRVTNRAPVTRLEQFDAAKKSLDDMIDSAVAKRKGNKARELTQLKNNLLERVDETNEGYGNSAVFLGHDAPTRGSYRHGPPCAQ